MDSRYDDRGMLCRVSTFGDLRIDGYLLLPAAFRSLSRPSSALSAQASTLRSLQLDLTRSGQKSVPYLTAGSVPPARLISVLA